ncbi:MAG: alkaline phosphatase family protein [Jatrophihabitantaceae bacterium]
MSARSTLAAAAALLACAACTGGPTGHPDLSSTAVRAPAGSVPRPQHVVVVVMENHSYSDIVGNRAAPYINSLVAQGASFTASFANYHPSQPNYLVLFSGSAQGVSNDSCPHTFATSNLGAALTRAGLTFTGYAEGLPRVGDSTCSAGAYARKHAPWTDFSNVAGTASRPFTDFPADYTRLPAVSFVVPDLDNDMHDGSVARGDAWLRTHLGGYVTWARAHHSLLVLSWDEDDGSPANHIPTVFVGGDVRAGRYSEHIDHYRVLRTIEDAFGLVPAGQSARAAPITDVWKR